MMNSLNFLEKLLDGADVEWKALGEVTKKISSGGTPQTGVKEYWEGGTIPWMSSGEVNLETIYETEKFITEAGLKNSSAKYVSKNSLVIALAGQGKTRGKVARTRIDLTTNQSLASIAVNERIVNPDYLYHFIKTQYENLRQISSGSGTRGGLNLQMISNYKFPLPCPEDPEKSLNIQTEIVRILDAFTSLTTELTTELKTELATRKKQYNYYRNQLLSFEGRNVEWKALGEIGEFIRGKRFTKADYVEDGVSAIHYGEIYTHYGVWTAHVLSKVRFDMTDSLRFAKPGDVVIAGVGETVEDVGKAVAWIGSEKVAIHDDSYAFRHSMNAKFISYVMQTAAFIDEKAKHVSRGKVNRLLIDGIAKVRMPIPYPGDAEKSLAEQARIVAILDKFDALTNSLSEGLLREIALRQRQYEYYGNLLFNFPKLEEGAA